jgi:hypothetical protein
MPIFATLLLTMASAAVPAAAQSPLAFERSDYAAAGGARGVTAADFNRDGWIDIAVANHQPDGISVLLNQHGTGFSGTFITQAGGPFDITTGDLNSDGIPDIVVANADGNMINVAFGLRGGGFRTPLQIGAMGNPRGVTVADADGDGNQDLIYTQYYFQGVQVLFGDGRGHFDNRTFGAAGVGPNPQGVVVCDFNLDGLPDIAVAASGGVGLTVLTRFPAGVYSRQDVAGPRYLNVLTVGDFNKDGRPDIAAASTATSEVFIYLNTRTQGWVLSSTRPSGSSPRGIASADLNRDGALDLVTGNRGGNSTTILLGDGSGGFAVTPDVAVANGGRTVAVADFDNDGRPDVATGNEYADKVTVLSNVTAFPAAGFGFTKTELGSSASTFGSPPLDVADFDGDGKPDVLTEGANGGIRVIYGRGATTDLPTVYYGPGNAKAGNVNGDGYPDIIYLDRNPADPGHLNLEVYIGAGTAGFGAHKSTPTGIAFGQPLVADVNRDGRLDAVLLGSVGSTYMLEVWFGTGDGAFTIASRVTLPQWASKMMLADVDRNGTLDIVTTGQSLTVWPNDGTGHFAAQGQSVPIAGFSTYGGDLGDLNHDGYVDFVGGGSAAGSGDYSRGIVVLMGGANGFGSPVLLVGAQADAYLADVTLDGNLDIVNERGELLPGRGDGTFDAIQAFDFAGANLQVADFNRDGLPDIIVAPELTGLVQVLLNQRGDTNHAPTVSMVRDLTFQYASQFDDEGWDLDATGSDPELHALTYTWYAPDGTVIGSSRNNYTSLPILDPGRHQFTVKVDDGRGGTASDTAFVTVLPEKEVVTWVAFATSEQQGSWGGQSDASAAGRFSLRDTQADQPKVTTPLANPASYVDIWVFADPTQTYKLWARLKATNNHWANDSLWLQFEGAVDQNGQSYAPGTTSGISVNLEECSNCGVSEWGWRDDGWGQRGVMSSLTLRFTQGGYHRVRIQTREDGVSIDQLVLSAEKYLTTRPGPVKNDATILEMTSRR